MTEMSYKLYNNQNTEIDKIDQLDTVSLKKLVKGIKFIDKSYCEKKYTFSKLSGNFRQNLILISVELVTKTS